MVEANFNGNCIKQKGVTLWFTGLSGSGKTTVAREVESRLLAIGAKVERLDGDLVREHLTSDLGFSRKDRDENIRRNSFVANLLTKNGIINLCCFISPYRKARDEARKLIGNFIEIYINVPLSVCENRDVKGLYKKARSGEIPEFTGISDPYEPPLKPEIELKTAEETVDESADKVIAYLFKHNYIFGCKSDLHLHTTASDGRLEPEELVQEARKKGFKTIAVTDHDTTGGLERALQAGEAYGVEVIPGLELSALEGDKEIHILGYNIDYKNKALQKELAKIIDTRNNRALLMIEKLNELGFQITLEEVKAIAGGSSIGRPHLAEALKKKGYIAEVDDAFTPDLIGRGGKAYVERHVISPEQSIKLIIEADGIPVLAHPGYLSDRTALTEADIKPYIDMGLKGIEVFYSRHTLEQVNYYLEIATRYDLLLTGGSDCHGDGLLGVVKLPDQYVEALTDASK